MTNMTELQTVLDDTAATLGVPGAAMGIIHGGEAHSLTTGVASIDAPVPVDDETLFMIGSTTKTFTATAALALVEAGVLDLDAPLIAVMPHLPLSDAQTRERLTLRHLLTHTGGFEGDVADTEDWDSDAIARSVADYGTLSQYAAPGTAFSYSNSGFRLIGRLIEVVTGDQYETTIRELVLDPLGMNDSFFLPWEVFSRKHAVGHIVDDDGVAKVAHTWGLGRSGIAEGGLVSSAADQVRYMAFHLTGAAESKPPISSEMRAEMQRQHAVAAPPFDGVGLPWLLTDMFGTTAVTHGGNIAGIQRSTMTLLPDEGFGITVLANSAAGGALGNTVTSWCFENLLGKSANEPFSPLFLSDEELEPFCGTWDSGSWGMVLTASSGTLTATFYLSEELRDEERHLPPPMLLTFCRPDEIISPQAPETLFGRFVRDETGKVSGLLAQGRALRKVSE